MPLSDLLARSAAAVVGAALLSCALCPLLAKAAPRLGLMDAPDEDRKRHGRPIPIVGGIAVWLAAGFALFLTDRAALLAWGWIGLMGGVGLTDDLVGWRAGPKLALQFGVSCVLAAIALAVSPSKGSDGEVVVALCGFLLALVVLVNAFNFTDNSNGQCAGLAVVSLGAEGLVLGARGGESSGFFPLIFAAAFLGFLIWNYPSARVFLGDCGSHLAGCAVAFAGLTVVEDAGSSARIADFLGLGLLAFVPLLDFAVAVGGRLLRGQAPWKGDMTHLFHRLVARGMKPAAAVAALWLAALVASALGALILLR